MSTATPQTWRLGAALTETMPHHQSMKALWETKWKFPCTKSIYPFHDGKYEDFEPVFKHLIEAGINDPMDEAYSNAFLPPAKALAERAEQEHSETERSSLLLRAACLLRIARFPYVSRHVGMNAAQAEVWRLQKEFYMSAAGKWEVPVKEISIPLTGSETGIPVYVRIPTQSEKRKTPVMLLMTGLDGYRPDNTARLDAFLARGWASVVCEIPGTADCPVDPANPEAGDEMWSALLSWIAEQDSLDAKQVLVWGLSAGGYHAVKIAHTHKQKLKGVVAQGAGTHHFFGKEWLEHIEKHEYPFDIFPFLAQKHGYSGREEYTKDAQKKFSLLETGILDKPSTKLLLVNGTNDGLMPIEDSILCLEHGSAKSARFYDGCLHMGYPHANTAVYEWLDDLMADASQQNGT